jgi:hypothetical protein
VRGRLELVGGEDAEAFAGTRDLQSQSDLEARPLEVRHTNAVHASGEAEAAGPLFGLMLAVVVDDELVIEEMVPWGFSVAKSGSRAVSLGRW